jgi:CRISPR-associated protein Csx10
MQLKLEFTLTFENDWHINAGFGADGKADAVIEQDPQGKPIISGTTIKGIFRDALYDLALNLGKDTYQTTDILGAPGYDSRWHFSAALPQAKSIPESVVATGVRVDPRYRRAEDNKYFKRELGAAEVFRFYVTRTTTDDKALQEVEWLVAAAAYIERLGGRRRRGNGKCSISLSDNELHQMVLDSFATQYCGEEHNVKPEDILEKLQIRIETLQIIPIKNPSHRYRVILCTERPVIIW